MFEYTMSAKALTTDILVILDPQNIQKNVFHHGFPLFFENH